MLEVLYQQTKPLVLFILAATCPATSWSLRTLGQPIQRKQTVLSFIFKLVGHLRLGKIIIKKNLKLLQICFRCKHLFSFTSYIECFVVATDNVLSHGNKQQPHVSWCWYWCHGDGTGVLFVENLDHR